MAMTAISSAASSANADEHDPAAQTLTGHSADAEFEGGVTALSPAARRGMEGYVRPYEPDCCPAHDCYFSPADTRYPHDDISCSRALHA